MGTSPWICTNIKKTCICMLVRIAHLSCHLIRMIWSPVAWWTTAARYILLNMGNLPLFIWIISTGCNTLQPFQAQCFAIPSYAYLSKATLFVTFCQSTVPKIQILGKGKSSNNLTSSFLSHLASTRILTIQAESSTSCYIRVLEAKGMEEMKQTLETANRKTSLKLPWIGDTYLFVLFYASGFLWNREE